MAQTYHAGATGRTSAKKWPLKTWRMPDRRGRHKNAVAAPRMSGDLFGCSLGWRVHLATRSLDQCSQFVALTQLPQSAPPTRAPAQRRELSTHRTRQPHKPRCASRAALPRKAPVPEQDPALTHPRLTGRSAPWHGQPSTPAPCECRSRVSLARPIATGCLRSEEHTSELQSPCNLVCRLLLEKKKNNIKHKLFNRIKHRIDERKS